MISDYRNLVRLAVVGIALAQVLTAVAQEAKHPNIIFLLTDDHRWDVPGAMVNKIIQTPHRKRTCLPARIFSTNIPTWAARVGRKWKEL